ncbi:hypothetical protein [Sphingobium sp. UBA5915]|uniref:DUF968 domain-containing protein n=1 Tax=Sphingobium sp. UBA5915 TaxID=1947530 RepID=UPI0025FAF9E5|nr:hypothetical protein [Sphingobium sp. UBA5915]
MLRSSAFAPRKKNSHKADFYLRAPSFLQWLRGRNCLLCDKGGCEGRIEAAHVDYAGGKGVGIKVADRYAIPLCSAHHRAQHNWGWQTFEDNFRIDALEASKAYWNAWPGRRAWEDSRA